MNVEDLIPTDVTYPNFLIEGNNIILGDTLYIFDTNGSVSSILPSSSYKDGKTILPNSRVSIPTIKDIAKAILDPIKSILEDLINGVKNFFKEQLANVIAKFNVIVEHYEDLKQKIQDRIASITDYLTSLYINAKNKVISAYEFAVKGIIYIFNTLRSDVKNIWNYAIKKVNKAIETAKEYANKTMKYFNYALYGFIVFIIIAVILACVFRFAPIDLRVRFPGNA